MALPGSPEHRPACRRSKRPHGNRCLPQFHSAEHGHGQNHRPPTHPRRHQKNGGRPQKNHRRIWRALLQGAIQRTAQGHHQQRKLCQSGGRISAALSPGPSPQTS